MLGLTPLVTGANAYVFTYVLWALGLRFLARTRVPNALATGASRG